MPVIWSDYPSIRLNTRETQIFRKVRAVLVNEETDLDENLSAQLRELFSKINVDLVSLDDLDSIEKNWDILGIVGDPGFYRNVSSLRDFDCLKLGFSSYARPEIIRKSLKYLDAAIMCGGSDSRLDTITSAIFHFFESLTLPSLLNIDLADVDSIAKGIGLSFHQEEDSANEIIEKLPRESFFARSALLHFTCVGGVTLEEVYSISKAVSIKQAAAYQTERSPKEEAKKYRPLNIKMGMRILRDSEVGTAQAKIPRISLTAILFGI